MLEVKDLNVFHAGFENFNLNIEPSQIVSLLGKSGCGKTSILKVILGISKNFSGSIKLNNITLSNEGKVLINTEDRNIGVVFQDYSLFNHMNVADNICFGMKKTARVNKKEKVLKLLEMLQLSADFYSKYPYELSGGEQQRVALARTLAIQPKAILLDEPFSNLDTKTRDAIMPTIKNIIKKLNIPCIFVTHCNTEAYFMSGKSCCLQM